MFDILSMKKEEKTRKNKKINDDELRVWWPCHSMRELESHFHVTYHSLWKRARQLGLKKDRAYIHSAYSNKGAEYRHRKRKRALSQTVMERDLQAYAMYQKGVRFSTISRRLGYKDVSGAYEAVKRARVRLGEEIYDMNKFIDIFNKIES